MSDPHTGTAAPSTVTELLLARASDEGAGIRHGDETWTWAEHVRKCRERADVLLTLRRHDRPFHIGLLADNVPEFSFLLGGCAFAGAVLVGLNPTRRGSALARDIALADCQLVLAEGRHAALLEAIDLGGVERIDLESARWNALVSAASCDTAVASATADDLLMLIFTSGTGGDPKAVRCTHGKIAAPGAMLAERFGLRGTDTCYLSMPMFHSNAIMAGWAVGLAAGATLALRNRFSASEFLTDVRRFGATYTNYVGTPLSYVLATEPAPDDTDNPLRIVYGNEGSAADLERFAERFDCRVVDGFGSTEGGVAIRRDPDTPAGAMGRLSDTVRILDERTGKPCPPARLDGDGTVLNVDEAVGELVNIAGAGAFAGYYNDEAATAERLRDGRYHSGDLAYADERGYCYFAGRTGDWLRVGGENLGTAPIERALRRHSGIRDVAVYALPDNVGDRVTAALVPHSPGALDPDDFATFLHAQEDLGARQHPEIVRIRAELPRTATYKVRKRDLAALGTDPAGDELWTRQGREYFRAS